MNGWEGGRAGLAALRLKEFHDGEGRDVDEAGVCVYVVWVGELHCAGELAVATTGEKLADGFEEVGHYEVVDGGFIALALRSMLLFVLVSSLGFA